MRRLFVLAILFTFVSAPAAAQAGRFEVASVGSGGMPGVPPLVSVLPGGRVSAPNSTLRELVRSAYGVGDDRILGGPDWIARERFAIEAKAERTNATPSQLQDMLAALLAERFRLKVHREERELPVFVLTLARRDGRLGPSMRRAGAACEPITPPSGVPSPPPPPPGDSLRRPLVPATAGALPNDVLPGLDRGPGHHDGAAGAAARAVRRPPGDRPDEHRR